MRSNHAQNAATFAGGGTWPKPDERGHRLHPARCLLLLLLGLRRLWGGTVAAALPGGGLGVGAAALLSHDDVGCLNWFDDLTAGPTTPK